jgi:hypothetical protein
MLAFIRFHDMKFVIAILALLSFSVRADYPTETVVTPQNAAMIQAELISDVFGCALPITEALPVGTQTIGGRSYQTLSTGARYFKATSNTKLLIFHAGHGGEAFSATEGGGLIDYAIPIGWDILAINMPTGDHSLFAAYENPLRAFMTPIAESLNYVLMQKTYSEVTMSGLSGGGWSTVLYAAMDERITRSVPVAGSWPWYLRTEPRDHGDYEQTLPGLSTDYLDLYALAATGGREQLQIFYTNDPCCFSGSAPLGYLATTQAAAQSLGGDFGIEIVNNAQHNVPPTVYAMIAGEAPPPPPFAPIVASWALDDATGNTLSGNYPGTLYGAPHLLQSALAPDSGTAIKFNGTSQYALVPDHADLRAGSHEYSIEFYASFTGTAYGVAFGKFSTAFPYPGPTVFFNYANEAQSAGRIEFRDRRGAGYQIASVSTGLNDGTPRYYVFQRKNDSGTWKLQIWINGVLDAEQVLLSVENHSGNYPIYLFSRNASNQYINGTFDNARYGIGETVY